METKVGVGYSFHRHYKTAASQAAKNAFMEAGTDKADLVIAFGAIAYPQDQLVAAIRKQIGDAPLIGCSGNGLIASKEVAEETFYLGIMVIQSDALKFETASATGFSEDPYEVGRTIGATLSPTISDKTQCIITLADGININFDRYEKGMVEGLNVDRWIPLFGGASGDDWKMLRTFQYLDDRALTDGAVAFTLSGEAELAFAFNHGCSVLGEKKTITRSLGNVIQEIDGQPAYEVLREFMSEDEENDWGKTSVNLNMGFKSDEGDDEMYVRWMPSVDKDSGAITLPTEVSDGIPIWLMRRDSDRIKNGVSRIGKEIKGQLAGKKPKFVLHFDCAGRGKVIFRDQEKQDMLHELQKQVGEDVPWLGFSTYGEIGPINRRNCFRNYTLVLLAVV
jgi:hypothetical protein